MATPAQVAQRMLDVVETRARGQDVSALDISARAYSTFISTLPVGMAEGERDLLLAAVGESPEAIEIINRIFFAG